MKLTVTQSPVPATVVAAERDAAERAFHPAAMDLAAWTPRGSYQGVAAVRPAGWPPKKGLAVGTVKVDFRLLSTDRARITLRDLDRTLLGLRQGGKAFQSSLLGREIDVRREGEASPWSSVWRSIALDDNSLSLTVSPSGPVPGSFRIQIDDLVWADGRKRTPATAFFDVSSAR